MVKREARPKIQKKKIKGKTRQIKKENSFKIYVICVSVRAFQLKFTNRSNDLKLL